MYDFFDLIKGLTIASSESRKDWTLIEDGTGNVNVSSWILDGDPSYLVHEYVTQNPVLITSDIMARFGDSSAIPFQILESSEQIILNGAVDYFIDLDDSKFYLSLNYQHVQMDVESLTNDDQLKGNLFFKVRYYDSERPYQLQESQGKVDFTTFIFDSMKQNIHLSIMKNKQHLTFN